MKTEDLTATLDLALKASGLDRATVNHQPRLLTDNGASYIATDLAKWLDGRNMEHVRGAPYHPMTQGTIERWHQTLKNRILQGSRSQIEPSSDYNAARQPDARRRLLRARPDHSDRRGKDQTTDNYQSTLAASTASRITSQT